MNARRFAVLLSVVVFLVGCNRPSIPAGRIDRPGTYSPSGREWILTVNANGTYQIERTVGGTTLVDTPEWKPAPNWFFYIEDANHLWKFDGQENLLVVLFSEAGFGWHDLQHYKGTVPDGVKDGLPATQRSVILNRQRK